VSPLGSRRAASDTEEFTPDWAHQPGPDPQLFGMPATDDGSRTDVLLAQNMITCTHYEPDFDGFLGGEYGQHGKPDEFAAKLHEVLAAAG